MLISCGCPVFNPRVSPAAAGYDTVVERFPDTTCPDLLARLRLPEEPDEWMPIGALDTAIEHRQTNRKRLPTIRCHPK